MQSMNLVQIEQLMTKFEKQQEDLDVKVSVMDGAMVISFPFIYLLSLSFHVVYPHQTLLPSNTTKDLVHVSSYTVYTYMCIDGYVDG